jgi:hypothetical protein
MLFDPMNRPLPVEQIQFSLGHVSLHTTERHLGLEQDLGDAPYDRLGKPGDTQVGRQNFHWPSGTKRRKLYANGKEARSEACSHRLRTQQHQGNSDTLILRRVSRQHFLAGQGLPHGPYAQSRKRPFSGLAMGGPLYRSFPWMWWGGSECSPQKGWTGEKIICFCNRGVIY